MKRETDRIEDNGGDEWTKEMERGGEWRTQWPPGDLEDRQHRVSSFLCTDSQHRTLDMGHSSTTHGDPRLIIPLTTYSTALLYFFSEG